MKATRVPGNKGWTWSAGVWSTGMHSVHAHCVSSADYQLGAHLRVDKHPYRASFETKRVDAFFVPYICHMLCLALLMA